MGKIQQFGITYSQAQGVYNAGSRVQGMVTITVSEPMKMRNLRIYVHGRAKVHWKKTKNSGDSSHTKHYRAEEVYMEGARILFGSERDGTVIHPAGHHTYSFEVDIPATAPSSFEGEHGYVRYLCKATIDRPWKFDHDFKSAFTVIGLLDLNLQGPHLANAQEGSSSVVVTCCCCEEGTITCKFRINKKGFVPGENMIINAEINNGTSSSISFSKVALKQYIEFYGRSDSFLSSGELKPKVESEIMKEIRQGEIEGNKSFIWDNVPFRVPALPPSGLEGCRIIDIRYVVKFYVGHYDSLKLVSDIVVGTVPLRQSVPTGGAIISQPAPTAPPSDTPPELDFYEMPPPSYEECVKGQRHIKDEGDTDYTMGQLQWAPSYPMYNWPPDGNTSAPPGGSTSAPPGGSTSASWNMSEEYAENRV